MNLCSNRGHEIRIKLSRGKGSRLWNLYLVSKLETLFREVAMGFTDLLRARLVWMNIVALMFWTFSTGSNFFFLIGQSHSTVEELTTRVQVSDTTVLPLEPLWIRIIIRNDTHKTIKQTTGWQVFRWIY